MEDCYTLLGVSPAASSEEIEAAYQDKKSAPGIGEEALKELDGAYNEAIMATFAPIKPFAVPPPSGLPAAPASQAQPVKRPQAENSVPPHFFDEAAPVRSSYVRPPRELDGLVGEGATPSDEHLLNMDVGQLRDTYGYGVKEPVISTWGIRDRLLRYYAKSYVAFVVLEVLMAFTLGSVLQNYTNTLAGYQSRQLQSAVDVMSGLPGSEEAVRQTQGGIEQMQAAVTEPPSALEVTLRSFITTVYYFLFALPVPIAIRFFIMGEPPETATARWTLSALAVCAALVLHVLLSWLFGSWAGYGTSLAFVTIMLSNATLKYAGGTE